MNNQNGYIPEHLKSQWDSTVSDLTAVSEQRHEIEENYRQVVMAQIACREGAAFEAESSPRRQEVSDAMQQLAEVTMRYNQLIIARVALTDELKQWQLQTYFKDKAA